MKKLLAVCFILGVFSCEVFADDMKNISTVEKDLFGVEYVDENITQRLNRVENHLYGKTNSGTPTQRLNKIAETSGISFAPKKTAEEKRIAQADVEKEDNSVSYPVIDIMEEKTFNKTFQGENVYKRVARLEEKAFGKSSEGELSERTDRLKAKLLAVKQDKITYGNNYQPTSIPKQKSYQYQTKQPVYNYSGGLPPFSGYPTGAAANANSSNSYTYSESDFEYALSAAENMIFGKPSNLTSTTDRLNKLEQKIFKKTFSGDKIARLERVVSAASAKNANNMYKENKWDRYLTTGVQVGSILLMILAMIL